MKSTFLEALEPRILFSAAPVEAPAEEGDAGPETQTAEESVVVTAGAAQATAADLEAVDSNQEGLNADSTGSDQSELPVVSEATAIDAAQSLTLVDFSGESADLNRAVLEAMADAAAERWRATGLTAEQDAALDAIDYRIANLSGDTLGMVENSEVTLDFNGAGHGWFIDSTPEDDTEFNSAGGTLRASGGPAGGGQDLLTVLIHEQGHVIGLDAHASDSAELMYEYLSTGERRLPEDGQADGAIPFSSEGAHYMTASGVDAIDDFYTGDEDTVLNIPGAAGPVVVANDLPSGGTVLAIDHDDSSLVGLLTSFGQDGSFTYDPNGQFETLSVGQSATETFTYDILAVKDPLVDRALLARLGPGGTFNAYLLDDTGRTWDESRVNANGEVFGGVFGHMVTIGSQAENDFIVDLGGNFWIGLTDSTATSSLDSFDLSTLGTSENGNTSGDPLPPAGEEPESGEKGFGFQWITGEPFDYQLWNPSDPNDQGAGVLMGANGRWDDQSGGSSIGDGNVDNQTVIEFEIGAANLESYVENGFTLREVQAASGYQVNSLAAADNLLSQGAGDPDFASETFAFYSKIDLGSGGNFGTNLAYPTTDQTRLAHQARAFVYIPAMGDYTFAVSSGEGFGLSIEGATLNSTTGDSGSTTGLNGRLAWDTTRTTGDTLGVFNFPSDGFYEIDLVYFENNGGEFVELAARQGSHTSVDPNFRLVGDFSGGGLGVVTNVIAQDTATVTITVEGRNDPPTANAVSFTVGSSATNFSVDLVDPSVSFDIDDGDTLGVTSATQDPGDTTDVSSTTTLIGNVLSFNPNAHFSSLGPGDSAVVHFDYTVQDQHGLSASSTITVTVTGGFDGTTGDDHYLVRQDSGGNIEVHLMQNQGIESGTNSINSTLYDDTQSNLQDLVINALAGADTLTVDYGFDGGFFDLPIVFNGDDPSTGSGDALFIPRGTLGTVTHDMTGPDSGNIDIDGDLDLITYTGLEPVDMTGSTITDLILNLPGVPDNVQLSGIGGNNLRLESTDTPVTFERTDFTAPAGSVTINGAVGDILTLSNAVNLGSADLTANAGTINLNGGSVTAGDHEYNGVAVLGADTILTGADVTFDETVDSDGTARALTINASGATLLSGPVGASSILASLITDAAGSTRLDGGTVDTTGNQIYGDVLIIGADTVLTVGGNLGFGSTVDDADGTADDADLVAMVSGTTSLGGEIGGINPVTLFDLTTGGPLTVGFNVTAVNNIDILVDQLPGTDNVSVSANVAVTSNAGSVEGTAESILMNPGSSITADGAVTLSGTNGTGNLTGVRLRGASITSNSSGPVNIDGQGGDSGFAYNRGVLLDIGFNPATAMFTGSTITTGGSIDIAGTGGIIGIHATGVELVAATVESTGASPVLITGTGGAGTTFNNGVAAFKGTTIDSGSGNLTISGVGGGTSYGRGVHMGGDVTLESDGGDIAIDGTGGGTGFFGIGVDFADVDMSTTGTGMITLRGTGASGSLSNMGVRLAAASTAGTAPTTVSATDGAILIEGTANGNTVFNHGVQLAAGTQVGATGSGNVTVKGTGGAGTVLNHGVEIAALSAVSVTDGDLTVMGTARGTVSLNNGVKLITSNLAASGSGNIAVTGTGSISGTTGVFNSGINMSGGGIDTVVGNITLNGTGGTGTTYNEGLRIVGATLQSTSGGTLSLTGTALNGPAPDPITTGVLNTGVYLSSVTLDSSGSIGVTGTGGGGTFFNHGVFMQNIMTPGTVPVPVGTVGAGSLSLATTGNFFP